ncbi:macrophage mannose receptor 1-like [Labrus bergylta]|uniref:macrophage mannose receptor 1-like n=1 Tax=Labrus bergylta TaxID=56723 RepID=UPI003313960E
MNTLKSMADHGRMWNLLWPSRAWIGLYDDVDSWRWSLSDPDFYGLGETEFRRWANLKPNSGKLCAAMNTYGKWNDESCSKQFKPVCSNVTGTNVTFVLISTSLTWTDAQGYCREFYTDLASVRNMEENQKIKRLIPFLQSAWLGLSRESWKWSDGSDLTFPYWNWGEPNRFLSEESCVAANFKAGGRWEDWPCHWERSYICYTSGITQQVFRLSVQKKNPSLDLNDSATLDDILEQVKQKLKDKGLPENIQLSWRKQPDGNVFQKDKMEKEKTNEKEDEPLCKGTLFS